MDTQPLTTWRRILPAALLALPLALIVTGWILIWRTGAQAPPSSRSARATVGTVHLLAAVWPHGARPQQAVVQLAPTYTPAVPTVTAAVPPTIPHVTPARRPTPLIRVQPRALPTAVAKRGNSTSVHAEHPRQYKSGIRPMHRQPTPTHTAVAATPLRVIAVPQCQFLARAAGHTGTGGAPLSHCSPMLQCTQVPVASSPHHLLSPRRYIRRYRWRPGQSPASTPPHARPTAVRAATLIPGIPVRLRIPAINLDAHVESVGLKGAAMDVPSNPWDVAWFNLGPLPGLRGNAVIDGHLDTATGPAVFLHLGDLRAGDMLYVTTARGVEGTFKVTELTRLSAVPLHHLRRFSALARMRIST